MVIHQDFKPDSPLYSFLESSWTDQLVYDTSTSVSEDQAHIVQPISAGKPESSLLLALDPLINKPPVIEPILESVIQPTPEPILDISNMDISDSDEEDGLIIDGDLGSFSASAIEPNLNTPLSSTTQTILDLPSTSSP